LLTGAQTAFCQQAFTVHVLPSVISAVPPVHSGALAIRNGKWIFIGGRIDGMHIMQANMAFPGFGKNDSVFVVDPVSNTYVAANLQQLPALVKDALTSANMEYIQNGQFLYMIGGYGRSDSMNVHLTFPSLISIDLDCLVNAVSTGSQHNTCFRQLPDTNFAVAGGEICKIDTSYFLTFGHRFDGLYSGIPGATSFTQHYTHDIRRFDIVDDGINLSIQNYSAQPDTEIFHRRDFNLLPQIYPNGDNGYTAFGGVFRKNSRLPFHTPIDITSSNVQHQSAFNQNLNQYTTAALPVYDSSSNYMHTLFFGGMSLYTLDTISGSLVQDTLIPFVSTISKISRDPAGNLSEFKMQENMPALLGTNAKFIPESGVPFTSENILQLNNISGNVRVGYIVSGIHSDAPNVADLDPVSMSRPNATVYEVYIDANPNSISEFPVKNYVNNLKVYPNPVSNELNVEFSTTVQIKGDIRLYDNNGGLVRVLLKETKLKGNEHFSFTLSGLANGVYLCRVRGNDFSKIVKIIVRN
jgi:hypothetical protein